MTDPTTPTEPTAPTAPTGPTGPTGPADSGPPDDAPVVRLSGPWLLLTCDLETVAGQGESIRGRGGVVRRMQGSAIRTQAGLHTEFARALQFPAYFGHNWAALEDCLTDLEWLPAPAYLLVIEDAEQVLIDEPIERTGLFGDLLIGAAKAWATPVADGEWWDRLGVAFHVVLLTADDDAAECVHERWAEAGVTLSRV